MIFVHRRVLDSLGSPFDIYSLYKGRREYCLVPLDGKTDKGNTPEADNRYLPPSDQDPHHIWSSGSLALTIHLIS